MKLSCEVEVIVVQVALKLNMGENLNEAIT